MLVGCIRICPSISTLLRKLNRHAWLSTTRWQHIAQRCSRLNPSPVYQQKTRNTRMLSSCSLLLLYKKICSRHLDRMNWALFTSSQWRLTDVQSQSHVIDARAYSIAKDSRWPLHRGHERLFE